MIEALAIGGAFNPPTKAHIELAEYAMRICHLDTVVFIPSKMSYVLHEQGKNFSFTDAERYDMLQKIAVNRDWMQVCPYELHSERQPCSYETLCCLREHGIHARLLFGSDKLLELEHGWKHVEELCKEFGIVCMTRSHDDIQDMIAKDAYLKKLAGYITCVAAPDIYQDISSTKVRALYTQMKENEGGQDVLQQLQKFLPEELDGLKEWM